MEMQELESEIKEIMNWATGGDFERGSKSYQRSVIQKVKQLIREYNKKSK